MLHRAGFETFTICLISINPKFQIFESVSMNPCPEKVKKLNSYQSVERHKMRKLYFDGFNILKLTTTELN